MAKLVVITHPDQAAGFRLAGVETHPAVTSVDACNRLLALLEDEEIGIVAMEQHYLDELDGRVRRRLDSSVRPIVIGVPAAGWMDSTSARRRQMAELIRRAIGVRIAFRTEVDEG